MTAGVDALTLRRRSTRHSPQRYPARVLDVSLPDLLLEQNIGEGDRGVRDTTYFPHISRGIW
jgi:hypothetical protein